jgi:hypothetical protein
VEQRWRLRRFPALPVCEDHYFKFANGHAYEAG